jgi:hypothetical protein
MPRGVNNPKLADQIGKKVEPEHMKHYGQEQLSIIRQSSLKASIQFLSALMPRLNENFTVAQLQEFTLDTAQLFERWVMRNETNNQEDK